MADQSTNSLGEFLRVERERRGITIEQVASATKIGVKLLHSLEADQFSDLPAKPFVRGFVTSYARFIGLDPKEVLTRFGDYIDQKSHERPNREGGHSGYAFEKREGEQSRTMLWLVMGTFVVVGGVVMVVAKPALKHRRHGHADRLREVHAQASPVPDSTPVPSPSSSAADAKQKAVAVVAAPSPAPAPKASPSPVPTPAAVPATEPPAVAQVDEGDELNSGKAVPAAKVKQKAIFKALADVWVRYQCDDRPVMQFLLKKGKVLVLRGERQVRFQVSNPSSVTLNLNGRGEKVASGDKNLVTKQGTPTLIFPADQTEAVAEPFPGKNPLPQTPPPVQAAPTTPVPPNGPSAASGGPAPSATASGSPTT